MLRKPTLADFGLTTAQYSDYLKDKEAEEKIIFDLAKLEKKKVYRSEFKSNIGRLGLLVIFFTSIIYLTKYRIVSDLLKTSSFLIISIVFIFWKLVPSIFGIIMFFTKREATREEIDNASFQIRKNRLEKFEDSYKMIVDYEEKLKKYNGDRIEKIFPGISNFNFNFLKYSESLIKSILEKEEQSIKNVLEKIHQKNEVNFWLDLDGYTFEEEIAKLYIALGYKVKITPKSGDGGIDLILHTKDGNHIFVQCKNHKNPVGVSVVRELFGVVSSGEAEKGILICSSGITNGGLEFGKKNSIEILTVHDIVSLNKKVNPTPTNTIFDSGPKFSFKRKDGVSDNSFVLKGNVYVYNDIWDSSSEVMKIINSFQPVTSYVFEIVQYSQEIFYFKLYLKEHINVYKQNNSIILDAETGAIIQEAEKEEYQNHFTSLRPHKKKQRYYRKWK